MATATGLAACGFGCTGGPVARPPELDLQLGFSYFDQDNAADPPGFDDRGGGRGAVGLSFPITGATAGAPAADPRDRRAAARSESGLRLGPRVSFFGTVNDSISSRPVAGEPLLRIEDYAQLTVITPALMTSYRFAFGQAGGDTFFVEPGLGVGAAFGFLDFGERLKFGDRQLARERVTGEDDVSWSLNPMLRLGWQSETFVLGGELGSQFTGLDFDPFGQDAREIYLGLFIGVKLGR